MIERFSRRRWTRSALGLALALVVAGLGAALLLPRGEEPLRGERSTVAAPEPGEPSAAQRSEAGPAAADRGTEPARAAVASPDSAATDASSGLRVRVVHHATGEPVADAEVLWMVEPPSSLDPGPNCDWDAVHSRGAKAARTDLAGLAVLAGQPVPAFPARSNRPIAIARKGELYGELWNFDRRTADGVPELHVRTDATLVVTVQSESGAAAADVLVALVGERWPQAMPTLIQSCPRSFTTNSSGNVHVRHWRAVSSAWSSLAHGSAHVELPSFGLRAEVSEEHEGEQHVAFRLPATGSIELDLRAVPALGTGATVRLTQVDGKAILLADVENGSATFPFVPLACEWSISVEACGAQLLADRMRGPIAPGERVAKALGLGDKVLLRARLLTEQGELLTDQRVLLERAGTRLQAATTRSDGTVVVAVDRTALVAGGSVRWRTNTHWPDPRTARCGSEIPITMPVPAAIDCGDTRMVEEPRLITGRVVDERGQPWVLLHVAASRRAAQDDAEPDPLAVRMVGASGSEFEVRGPLSDAPIQVAATGDVWTERREARRGDEIVIVRPRSGKLTANVRSAPPNLQLTLQRPDGRAHRASRRLDQKDGMDHFVWDQLEPGQLTLTCRMPGQSAPIVSIPDVHVAPGDNHDPRLDAIDLRDACATARIQVLGFHGAPSADEPDGICWLREVGSSGAFEAVAIDIADGIVAIAVPGKPMEGRLCLVGHEPTPVLALPLDRTLEVTLQPLATVAVQFVRDDDTACGFGLEARGTPSASRAGEPPQLLNTTGLDADWHGLHEWAPIDAAGRASLRVGNAARHDVSVAKRGLGRITTLATWRDQSMLSPRSSGEPFRIRVDHGTLR